MEDAAGFFANVFGGERFVDYVSPDNYSALLLQVESFLTLCILLLLSHRSAKFLS